MEVLFEDYCYWREKTLYVQKLKAEKPYIKNLKPTPARAALFAEMSQWCTDKGVLPRQWVYSLFATRRWQYPPKLERSHLCSEKHLDRFAKFSDYKVFTARMLELGQSLQLANPVTYDPNTHISSAAEEAKRYYVNIGDVAACMNGMETETFGYHPKSLVCQKCSAGGECSQRLKERVNFDIGALREGKITSEEAYRIALARINGYSK